MQVLPLIATMTGLYSIAAQNLTDQNKQLNCVHAQQQIWPCVFLADLQKGIADNKIFSPKKTKKKFQTYTYYHTMASILPQY